MQLPFTKAQLSVAVVELGSLAVYINDFVKFAHPGGNELIFLNAAATLCTVISHGKNKTTTAKAEKVA
jgi:hypothetical protein